MPSSEAPSGSSGSAKDHVDLWVTHPMHFPHRLLVGAPREKAEPGVVASKTGGVYSCPVTAEESECRRMKLVDPGEPQLFLPRDVSLLQQKIAMEFNLTDPIELLLLSSCSCEQTL